jgi:hypothetical protein
MLLPMRPKPITPSCILFSPCSYPLTREPAARHPLESSSRRYMRAEMHTQDTPAALGEHLQIAAGLRRLNDAEAVFVARHIEIARVVARDLQEHAGVRAAFVELTRRMEKARTESEAGGRLFRSRIMIRIFCSASR